MRSVRLIDSAGLVIATARVADEGGHFGGTLDTERLPSDWRDLFDEFEEIVDGQMLSFLDDIQGRIAARPLLAVFDDGTESRVADLQVFPRAGEVSFRRAAEPAMG